MCLLTTTTTSCDHAECQSPMCCLTPKPVFPELPRPSTFLVLGLLQLNQLLLSMVEQNSKVQRYIEALSKHQCGRHRRHRRHTGTEEGFDPSVVEGRHYAFHLEHVGEGLSQVYKERGFAVTLKVVTAEGVQSPAGNLHFSVTLFSQENPPKRVLFNICGKKALRGTIEAESDSEGVIHFPNIVVNEVSSHYPNDAFYLVIGHTGGMDIKPYIVQSFTVRARKPMKRAAKACKCDIDDVAT